MLNAKIRQFSDNIHGSVYISELESVLMSTPFFYRLHDVYQSSTVYLTIPSNRTKRYEHSLGTMHLASQMFSSSISNASSKHRGEFFKELEDFSNQVVKSLMQKKRVISLPYLGEDSRKVLDKVLRRVDQNDSKSSIKSVTRDIFPEYIQDVTFNQYVNNISYNKEQTFLHQIILQSVRIAALFHDVGHPPYSHIIEHTLKKLYESLKKQCQSSRQGSAQGRHSEDDEKTDRVISYDRERVSSFLKTLSPYVDKPKDPVLLLNGKCSSKPERAFHERVGLDMLASAFKYAFNCLFKKLDNSSAELEKEQKFVCIYYILVCEFTFGILLEKKPLFSTIHRILDGAIDADRLDYIVRDTRNSGLEWGNISYERIIRPMRFFYRSEHGKERESCIAFPEKLVNDIDDIIILRYKIYSRLNSHHRTAKTAFLLGQAVELLAKDRLAHSSNDSCIAQDIGKLWEVMSNNIAVEEETRKVSMWNDSWLMVVLNSALLNASPSSYIHNILEELLLNRKRYYSLWKRQSEMQTILQQAIEDSGVLSHITYSEYQNLQVNVNGEENEMPAGNTGEGVKESLKRIYICSMSKQLADFCVLQRVLPLKVGPWGKLITEVLDQFKNQLKRISDYIVFENNGRDSLGIDEESQKDAIYLYSSGNKAEVREYDVGFSLLHRLKALRANNLWLYTYVEPCIGEDVNQLLEDIKQEIVQKTTEQIEDALRGLFS